MTAPDIGALTAAATPGPWTVRTEGGRDATDEWWFNVVVDFPLDPDQARFGMQPDGLMMGGHESAEADAAFIAAARTAVPELLAERDRYRKALRDIEDIAWAVVKGGAVDRVGNDLIGVIKRARL